jgi:ubiquinone/menaquinone biosynthesis C-methylase UbiE
MDKKSLYDALAQRKSKPKDFLPYQNDNGRVNKCVDLFKDGILKSGGTIVDVGGGIGDLTYALKDKFEKCITLDISTHNLNAAKEKGSEVCWCDVDVSGLAGKANNTRPALGYAPPGSNISGWGGCAYYIHDNTVNVVTALDFIEHIIDPELFARECFRVLKSNGQVFINTPNIQFFKHIEQLISGTFPHTSGDTEVFHGGHLAFFTFNDLCQIFGSTGFKNFKQIKDEECYAQPPELWVKTQNIKNQDDYVNACMRLGNPNLLFICEK